MFPMIVICAFVAFAGEFFVIDRRFSVSRASPMTRLRVLPERRITCKSPESSLFDERALVIHTGIDLLAAVLVLSRLKKPLAAGEITPHSRPTAGPPARKRDPQGAIRGLAPGRTGPDHIAEQVRVVLLTADQM